MGGGGWGVHDCLPGDAHRPISSRLELRPREPLVGLLSFLCERVLPSALPHVHPISETQHLRVRGSKYQVHVWFRGTKE